MNTFGHSFRITTFGESHSKALGVVIDGCPSGKKIDMEKIQAFLARRRPGQSEYTTSRQEMDEVECLSGLEDEMTLGTPIALLIHNRNQNPKEYNQLRKVFRPSHADYTTQMKYGISSKSGGGRASARETVARVAAASVAEQVFTQIHPSLKIVAYVERVKHLHCDASSIQHVSKEQVEKDPIRCPDPVASRQMQELILETKSRGDTVGGVIGCSITGCPVGLGEPVFDKLEADLAKAMLSLPASKGFEIGSGFSGTELYGSEHNDLFFLENGVVRTKTNNSGGIQGGIANGEAIVFRVAFKPVSTIFMEQTTLSHDFIPTSYKLNEGRHDPCVLPRAVPMVEAMGWLVVMDHFLRQEVAKKNI